MYVVTFCKFKGKFISDLIDYYQNLTLPHCRERIFTYNVYLLYSYIYKYIFNYKKSVKSIKKSIILKRIFH